MELTLSYSAKFHSGYSFMAGMLGRTQACFTDAVRFLCDVCEKEYSLIQGETTKGCLNAVEPLVHATKKNPSPKYPFDELFHGMPSYLRRSAIALAAGKVKAFHSLVRNWEDGGRKGARPAFPSISSESVPLYYRNMFMFTDKDGNPLPPGELSVYAMVKVLCSQRELTQDSPLSPEMKERAAAGRLDMRGLVWDWIRIRIKPSDIRYFQRLVDEGRKLSCPALVRSGPRWGLRFTTEGKVTLGGKGVFDQTVLAVDLGINSPATCCVMDSGGTVLARRFFKPARDIGCLDHKANMVSRAQSHGSRKTPVLWRMADNANRKLSDMTADFIVSMAEEFSVDVIVFEHMDLSGRRRGPKKRKLHLWRAKYVQELVTNRAHARGMRIARVCAWGTSKFAFDGSGAVERGINNNYSICRFKTGKIYNCDLSAAYNIGARYFIQGIGKTMPATVWSELTAKVPELAKRTTCTLSSLIKLNAELPPSGGRRLSGGKAKAKAA